MAKKSTPAPIKPGLIDWDEPKVNKERIQQHKTKERYLRGAIRAAGIDLSDGDLIFIKSTKGTGKTEVLGDYIARLKSLDPYIRVLQIGHRRSLSRSLSERLGLKSYLDHDELQCMYSLSLDSLARIDPKMCKPYPVVIIDESEQVFRHLFGDTTDGKREEIFSLLLWLVRNADQVICTDADLTHDLTISVISWMRRNLGQDRVIAIVNDHTVGRVIDVYESKDHILAQLIVDIADGKKVYVPVAELKLAKTLETLLKQLEGPDGKPVPYLVLTGETSDTQQALNFMADPTNEARKYHVLIATSTLSTGVSIDGKWFDAIYGLFDGSVYTYQDCDQAISRVRECQSVNVWLHDGRPPRYASEKLMREQAVKKEFMTQKVIDPDDVPTLTKAEELYLDVETRIRWCESQWSCKRREKFIALKERDGWLVDMVETDKAMANGGKDLREFARDPRGDRPFRLIAEAKNLASDEYEDLRHKKGLKNSEKRALKKAYVASVFDLPSPADVTITHVRQVLKDNASKTIKNLKLLAADRADALERDANERKHPNGKAFTEFDHRTIRREIMQSALESTGISMAEVMERANRQSMLDQEISTAKMSLNRDSRPYRAATKKYKLETRKNALLPDQHRLKETIDYVRDNLNKINLFLNTRYSESDLDKSPGRVLNKVMGEFGLSLKLVKGVFHVDYTKVTELAKTKKVQDAAKEIG